MFARELTASPEVTSSIAAAAEKDEEEEEDDRRGMVSRWSYDSSDFSSSPVSGSPSREVEGQEAQRRVSVDEPAQQRHDQQQTTCAQEDSTSKSSSSSGSGSGSGSCPSSSSQEKEETTEQQRSGGGSFLPFFDKLANQLGNLQASLNHLISQATSIEAAVGEARDAMITLRDRARKARVDTAQSMMREVDRVEGQLAEVRRAMEGKGKDVVCSSDKEEEKRKGDEDEDKRRQGKKTLCQELACRSLLRMVLLTSDAGDQREQQRRDPEHKQKEEQERERETETKGKEHHTETSPGRWSKEAPEQPRKGPPSGPAPGGAEWV
ncbi:hypothetical protein QBC32DRAFT_329145 [Pseudoneurospora amorphoporcata]|uniref:ODAD1 central coiled coil region domain-containing protein n=1 Tax=Pseudoneurospora amorphoporcata TaxID=241081 RepID=A0AAN6NK57_9PEZI|nr:hypothetical protein QBC32DRAFT_329145 [Pseudoneurospora amorphoporcata]